MSVQLFSEDEVQSQINASAQLVYSSTPLQISSLLDFLRITTQSNFLISALNTIAYIYYDIGTNPISIFMAVTSYYERNTTTEITSFSSCNFIDAVAPAGFYSALFSDNVQVHYSWPEYHLSYADIIPQSSAMVDGFYGGCTPLSSLLSSNLECLYNISCLQVLKDYFLQWNSSSITSLATSKRQNISVGDLFSEYLFIEEWSPEIDYFKYFTECNPTFCTYTKKDKANLIYSLTLLLSLYGSLIIILRFIAILLVNIYFRCKRPPARNINCNEKQTISITRV